MLDACVLFYLKGLAPYLVVGQEIEFVLNIKMTQMKTGGEWKTLAVNSWHKTGNTVRFKILFSEELKNELERRNTTSESD